MKTHDIMSELRLNKTNNRTLTNKQQCNPENSNKEVSEVSKSETPSKTSKDVTDKKSQKVLLDRTNIKLKFESLILAQDERWRRA